jgi:small subunit ribosomal protein S9
MKVTHASGRRKRAVARATMSPGTGKVFINNISIENFTPVVARMRLLEPVQLSDGACEKFDIHVRTNGGGVMGQTEAARLAIARAIVEQSRSSTLRQAFLKYDRHLLVADVRRKEMRKPNDSKARAKRQKSYR